MAVKTFTSEILTSSDTNTYLANSGLVYVKSQTVGTGVSTVEVTGAFSATYDNYLVTYSGGTQSVDAGLQMQFGTSATLCFGSLIFGNYAAATVSAAIDNNAAAFSYVGGGVGATCFITVMCPFLATSTEINARVRYSTVYGNYVGHKGDSTSYTSFKFNSFGTLTGGTITVYGYRKA